MVSTWLVLTAVTACTWQPVTRDVDPVLLIPGPARVLRLLDEGRYALIAVGEGPATTLNLLRLETRERCQLPPGSIVAHDTLLAPNLRGAEARTFLQPVFRWDGEQLNIYYTDENCMLRGPFAEIRSDDRRQPFKPLLLQLRSDSRHISIIHAPDGTLRLVDPWTRTVTVIAERVDHYELVQLGNSSSAPEALWLIEDNRVTQRALDGTLLLARGSNVNSGLGFAQTLRDQLRVSYVDDGDLYEIKGPAFEPVLIAEDACAPRYQDVALDLWLPCRERQLVRINLANGMITRFAPQVYASYVNGDVTFDLVHDNPDNPDDFSMFVSDGTTGATPRAKLEPRPNWNVNVVANKRMLGLSADGQLGIWTLDGKFTAGYTGVRRLNSFRDQRTGQFLWLIAYAVDGQDVATVGVVEQRQLEAVVASIEADAGVPGTSDAAVAAAKPLVIAERAHWKRYEVYLPSAVSEPVILALEPPITVLDEKSELLTGSLNAHLLSAEESTHVDDGVHSYQVVTAPVPGILYGILQGERAGLWFAAL